MLDALSDLIFELHEQARDLFDNVSQLDAALDEETGRSRTHEIADMMKKLCAGMSNVVRLIDNPSIVDRFFRVTGGVAVAPRVEKALDEFLDAHEKQLRGIGVSGTAIERLRKMLEKESGNENEDDSVTVSSDLLENLQTMQKLVCKSAELAGLIDRSVLKSCVKGVMGAATVVVDITGLLTVPDVTGLIIWKAVKSTWFGGKMVKEAIEVVGKAVAALSDDDQAKKTAESNRAKIKPKLGQTKKLKPS